jgi:hypothetical protein
MKMIYWNIVCKNTGKQLNFAFLLGAIASADVFEKLDFPILFTSMVKG